MIGSPILKGWPEDLEKKYPKPQG